MSLVNTGLSIHRQPKIVFPAELGRTMLSIVDLLPDAGLEYGLYLKGEWRPEQAAVVVDPAAYYFPAQQVSGASIQFLEEPPGPEWNVVIHRHPSGCRRFSSTDQNSINEEFLASLLFIPAWDFPDAVVNVPLAPGSKLQVRAEVEVAGNLFDVPEELRRSVREKLQPLRMERPDTPALDAALRGGLAGEMGRLRREEIGVPQQLGRGTATPVSGAPPRARIAIGAGRAPTLDRAIERAAAEETGDLLYGLHPDDRDDVFASLGASSPSTVEDAAVVRVAGPQAAAVKTRGLRRIAPAKAAGTPADSPALTAAADKPAKRKK